MEETSKERHETKQPHEIAHGFNTSGHHNPRNIAAENKEAGKNVNLITCKPHRSDTWKIKLSLVA